MPYAAVTMKQPPLLLLLVLPPLCPVCVRIITADVSGELFPEQLTVRDELL